MGDIPHGQPDEAKTRCKNATTGRTAKKPEPGKNAAVSAPASRAIERIKDNGHSRNCQNYEYHFCNHHDASAAASQYFSDKLTLSSDVFCWKKPKSECLVPSRANPTARMMRFDHNQSTPFGLSTAGGVRRLTLPPRNTENRNTDIFAVLLQPISVAFAFDVKRSRAGHFPFHPDRRDAPDRARSAEYGIYVGQQDQLATAPSAVAFWLKTSLSLSVVTVIGSPTCRWPRRISSASGSSMNRSTARRIGRAPYCGS